jgi:hypothetical protein
MKVLILYRPDSEHGRIVEEFIREFQFRYSGEHVEVINIDSRDGIATATLYDIMQYPAILVIRNDGAVQKVWMGEQMPLMDEVASYAAV